jgi:uncharacterized protein (DUF1330 family)
MLVFGKNPEQVEGYAKHTASRTMHRVGYFHRWVWEQEDKYVAFPTQDHAESYLQELAYDDYSAGHKAKCQQALKRYFRWREYEYDHDEWEPEYTFSTNNSNQPRDFLSIQERRLIREVALEYRDMPYYQNYSSEERERMKPYIAKLVFAANQMPQVDTHQDTFFRRWLLVAFPNKFTKKEDDDYPMADPTLEDTLMDEMEGILNFAVEGLQRLRDQDGEFTNELSTAEVRQQWNQYGDPIDQFIRNWLETGDGRSATHVSELYRYYEKFMQDIPSTPVSQKMLTQAIKNRFDNPQYGRYRNNDGKQYRGFKNVHVRHDRM